MPDRCVAQPLLIHLFHLCGAIAQHYCGILICKPNVHAGFSTNLSSQYRTRVHLKYVSYKLGSAKTHTTQCHTSKLLDVRIFGGWIFLTEWLRVSCHRYIQQTGFQSVFAVVVNDRP